MELPRKSLATIEEYDALDLKLAEQWKDAVDAGEAHQAELDFIEFTRYRARTDLFYLLTELLKRPDARHQWILDRCNEVQTEPDGMLDLWSREHYKSTIITFALSIQDIFRTHGRGSSGEEYTIALFSFTRPIAKAFLQLIKREFEINADLIRLFPEILYQHPKTEADSWTDEAFNVKRTKNRREATVSAWGVYEGQPTSMHFDVRVYDDMVTLDTVKTPDRIQTTTAYWGLSNALGSHINKTRYIGTRYHYNDPYKVILERKAARPRIHPATDDGTLSGKPVFWTDEKFRQKVQEMGRETASTQLLQNPISDTTMGFDPKDFRSYPGNEADRKAMSRNHVRVILVDPSSGKQRKYNDYTSIGVYALGHDNNYYLLDGVRDKLKLSERTDKLFQLHRKWAPIKFVGYEDVGLQSDIEHIQYRMGLDGYHFDITPMAERTPKKNKINRLQPVYENHRMYYPEMLKVVQKDGRLIDLVQVVRDEEHCLYPVPIHDDWLDMESGLESPEFKKRVFFPNDPKGGGGPPKLPIQDVYA